MTGRRAALTIQIGVLLSAAFLLMSSCSVAPVRSTFPAESAVKTDATIAKENLGAEGLQPEMVDQFEAILCGSHTSQTPECEGYRHHRAGQIELAIEEYKAALVLAQETQDPRRIAVLHLLLGIAYSEQGQYEMAAGHYRQAAKLFQENGDIPWTAATLYMLGNALASFGQNEEALAVYLGIFAAVKDRLPLEKESDREFVRGLITGIIDASVQLGKAEEALGPLSEAVEIFRQKGETKLATEALDWIARIYTKLKDPEKGLVYFAKLLKRSQVERDRYLESEITYQMGILLFEAGSPEKALHFQERALELCEEANNSRRAIDILGEIGAHYQQHSKPDKALEYYERALKLSRDVDRNLSAWEKLDLRRSQGQTLLLTGQIYGDLEQNEKAVEFYRQAREAFLEAGAKRNAAGVLLGLGLAYLKLGRFRDALISLQQEQEEIEQKIPERQVKALINLAKLSDLLGDVDNVQKYFLEALELYQQIGNAQQEAFVLVEIGRLHQDMSQYDKALNFYHQALSKYQEAKDQKGQGEVLASIGEVYLWIDDYETAAQYYQDALETSRAARDAKGEIQTLAMLYLIDVLLGREEALKEHVRQVETAEKKTREQVLLAAQRGTVLQDPQARDNVLALALLHRIVGQTFALWGEPPDPAIPALNAALQIYQALPHTRESLKETAVTLYYLGVAHGRLRQYDEALKAFQQAETIARRLNSPEVFRVLYRMGSVREEQGRFQEAFALYTQAAEIFEKVGLQQRLEEVKVPLRERAFWGYQNIVKLLFRLYGQKHDQHYIEQAFLYHEKGKARTLLDLLKGTEVRIREGIAPILLKEEEKITTRISRLHRDLASPELSKEREKQLLDTLAEQEQAWKALQVKMAVANPKYAELTSPQVAGIQQVQAILDKETLLLEYALGEEKSFLWGITQGSMQAYELPAEEAITQLVEQYLSTLRAPLFGKDEIERHSELGRKLYHMLLQPAAGQLQGKSQLIIVPDGSLYYLPFEALIADDDEGNREKVKEQLQSLPYLVKNYTVTYTPSASVLVTLEKNRSKQPRETASPQAPLLAFGDPLYEAAPEPSTVALTLRGSYEKGGGRFQRLEYSAEEVKKIAGIYGITLPSDALNLREKAAEKRLQGMDLTRYRILHFATHAILSDEVKWITQPALVLSLAGADDAYDGFLQMGEIFNLRLDADLVVLSACDTGKGKLYRGEGVVGLTRAFMYAGTPSVVASLWKVNDQSTSLFMEFFYRNLKEGQSKAEALRQAKKQLIQTQVWSDTLGQEQSLAAPYFWAPFILIGSGN